MSFELFENEAINQTQQEDSHQILDEYPILFDEEQLYVNFDLLLNSIKNTQPVSVSEFKLLSSYILKMQQKLGHTITIYKNNNFNFEKLKDEEKMGKFNFVIQTAKRIHDQQLKLNESLEQIKVLNINFSTEKQQIFKHNLRINKNKLNELKQFTPKRGSFQKSIELQLILKLGETREFRLM